VALAEQAIEESESQILVLDDGFQHRRLARNLDVVLIDATQPWGHGQLLPRGLLRESPASLRRAGAVVLTRCDQVSADERNQIRRKVGRHAPGAAIAETVHRPASWVNSAAQTLPIEEFRERVAAGFCGIGNPGSFRRTLAGMGLEPVAFRIFPDHHAYTRQDVQELHGWAKELPADCMIATTQKDLVKLRLPQLGGRPLWALRIGLAFEAGQDELERELDRVV
jgi:tetraacyldisaccharide 4'-kinase